MSEREPQTLTETFSCNSTIVIFTSIQSFKEVNEVKRQPQLVVQKARKLPTISALPKNNHKYGVVYVIRVTDQKSLKANDDHLIVFLVDCICIGSDGDMGNYLLSSK